jgi:putative transcriptional regulator
MIVNRLSRLMKNKGLSQKDVAVGAGLAINTVAGIYHDRIKRIDLETMDKICAFLGASVGDIFQYEADDKNGSIQG